VTRSTSLRRPHLVALLAAALFATGCDDLIGPAEAQRIDALPRALSASEEKLIAAGNTFAVSLLREVHAAVPDSTVFLSPLSASMALGMTMNGGAGATLDQMRATLGFGSLPLAEVNASYEGLIELLRGLDPKVDFRLANALFHRNGFQMEQPFLDVARGPFGAEVRGLDFSQPAAAITINDWVKTATGGRIDRIVEPPIDALTVAFLMNAVYFKGDWANRFDAEDTRSAPFHRLDGSTRSIRLMSLSEDLPRRQGDGWVAAEVPYGGDAWRMTVAVPVAGNGLAAVLDDLDAILDPDAQWGTGPVDLFLPRFELEWERQLNDDLKALGMVNAFDEGLADFTPMHRDARALQLHIKRVKQKTFLKVDEVGTEAAAVTSVEMTTTSAPITLTVRADRPFFIAIRERLSGTVLFAGLIVEAPED
jgi:serine protease inhibitor